MNENMANQAKKIEYLKLRNDLIKIRRELQSAFNNIEYYEKRINYSLKINDGVNVSNLGSVKEEIGEKIYYIKNIIIPNVEQKIASL